MATTGLMPLQIGKGRTVGTAIAAIIGCTADEEAASVIEDVIKKA